MQEFTAAFYVNNLLAVLAEYGIDGNPLLRQCSIQPGTLRHADSQVPLERYFCLVEEAMAVSNISVLGLRTSVNVPVTAHGLLGYTILSASTLGGALEHYCRYGSHLASMVHARLAVQDDEAHLSIRVLRHYGVTPPVERYLLMEATGFLTRLADPLGLKEGWLDRVEMPIAADGDEAAVGALLSSPVEWGCERLKLVFPAALLDCPIEVDTSLIDSAYDQQCALLLEELRSGLPMSANICRLNALRPSDLADVDEMAQILGISKRTLQRRLREEGTNYRDLIHRFRMHFSQFYLENTTMPASEIGYLVGYTEPVNFFRAFKSFFGFPPGDIRKYQNHSKR